MDIYATSKYVRVSPRKMQLLAKSVAQNNASEAVIKLGFIQKSGATELKKTIASALANAKNRGIGVSDNFFIKEIHVLPGSAMKRFRAVSRGMAHEYKKRMSHIKVILAEKPKVDTKPVQKKVTEKPTENQPIKVKVQKEEKKNV